MHKPELDTPGYDAVTKSSNSQWLEQRLISPLTCVTMFRKYAPQSIALSCKVTVSFKNHRYA